MSATSLALNHITSFSLAGTTLSVLGKSFGTFNAISYTTIVSTRSAVGYAVFGTYNETFATGLVGAGSPNAEIDFSFSFSIPSNRDRCEDDGCPIGVSAMLTPFSAPITTGANPVPEPASIVLLGFGLAGLGTARRRRAA